MGEIDGDNDVLGINIKNQNTSNGSGGMLKFIGGNGNNLTAYWSCSRLIKLGKVCYFLLKLVVHLKRMRVDHSGLIGIGTNKKT